MKKIQVCVAIVAAVVLIGAAPATAQMRLGGVVDLNFASLTTDDSEFADYVGTLMRLGVGGVLEYGINDKLSFVTEPMLLGKGAKGDAAFEGYTLDVKVKLSYFELPLLAKYTLSDTGKAQPYLLAGPTIGFKTGAKVVAKVGGGEDGEDTSDTEDISEEVSGTDLGLAFGGGVSMPVASGRAFVEAQYVLGLANIDTSEESSTKNKGFQLRFGITFPIGKK
jgi:hypothetical protein